VRARLTRWLAWCALTVSANVLGRVIVGVDGSPGSLEALRFALGQAYLLETTLIPVLAWVPPGGEVAARRVPAPAYSRILRDDAEKRLLRAFDEGLGGLPPGVRVEPWVIRGATGPALVETAERSNDLLVVGAGRRGMLRHAFRASTARYCLAHAACPVIAVPPPKLQAEIPSHLRWKISTDRLLDELTHSAG
jgi:nucleotide-binding universal stress UspA family protein